MMARVINFLDGSHEILFCESYDTAKKAKYIERILRKHLGDDSAELFCEIMQECEEELNLINDDLKRTLLCDKGGFCMQETENAVIRLALIFESIFQ